MSMIDQYISDDECLSDCDLYYALLDLPFQLERENISVLREFYQDKLNHFNRCNTLENIENASNLFSQDIVIQCSYDQRELLDFVNEEEALIKKIISSAITIQRWFKSIKN